MLSGTQTGTFLRSCVPPATVISIASCAQSGENARHRHTMAATKWRLMESPRAERGGVIRAYPVRRTLGSQANTRMGGIVRSAVHLRSTLEQRYNHGVAGPGCLEAFQWDISSFRSRLSTRSQSRTTFLP